MSRLGVILDDREAAGKGMMDAASLDLQMNSEGSSEGLPGPEIDANEFGDVNSRCAVRLSDFAIRTQEAGTCEVNWVWWTVDVS
ncbi:hypothetical protein ACP70R_010733 [Stipagrostis hirtigluma subsp. patula]